MSKLILTRHGQSTWNAENRFTGWVDVELSEKGKEEAKDVYDLIQFDPFYNQTKPPKYIKADHYEYKFAPWNHKDKKAWWVRKYLKEYLPPLSLENESLRRFLGKK